MYLEEQSNKIGNSIYELDDSNGWKERKDLENEAVYVETDSHISDEVVETKLSWFNTIFINSGAETKGIEPITEEEQTDDSLLTAALMWFSANMVLPAYAIGGLGPLVFSLNFGTSVLVIIFFSILGLLPVAFFSLFGVQLGLRQMTLSRYLIGNITARIFALINTVACVGWGIVNTVASAQLLNMVNENGNNLPLWAGCLVIIGATLLVTFFGINIIHLYNRYSWIPNFAVFLVIIARLKKSGNFTNGDWGSGPTTAGNVLSFGSTVFGFAAGWTTYASDYTVYMPKSTNRFKIFFSLIGGLSFPLFFCMILGAASAMGAVNDPEWAQYYNSNGMGGLTYAILVPNSLHGFGQFCCVILAMSTVSNNVPNMYTVAMSVQSIWDPLAKIPRIIWTIAGNAAALGISIPACYYFATFMEYFMDSISYYLSIYIAIALTEHFVFRKNFNAYIVEDWDDWNRLPIGIAGTSALIVGAFGVALGMSQTYWVGEIGRLIGEYGGDIGFELGASWSFVVYILLRPLEIKYLGR